MEEPNQSLPGRELTTTLHLGVRSIADSSPNAVIENLINESTSEEQSVIREILGGTGERAMVFINRGPSKGARFLITSEGASIGRSPSNDIYLDDVTVSRTHGKITSEGSLFTFTDSGSLNGSYINNKQSTSHALSSGDEIQIGKFHMIFISSSTHSGEK